jgi:hypothetical protein
MSQRSRDRVPVAFPILECFHIVGFAFSVGTIALVDFRLLGWGMRRETPAQIAGKAFFWTLGGLVVIVLSVLMLFSSDPDNYDGRPAGEWKAGRVRLDRLGSRPRTSGLP